MRRVIAFSLWGTDPKYVVGAYRNCELTHEIFPGWTPVFYHDDTVPQEFAYVIRNLGGETMLMPHVGSWSGMFWRFHACDTADVMLSRDTDSRLSKREKEAVDEWLASSHDFHIMRDHPYHKTEILGGTWGARNRIIHDMQKKIESFCNARRAKDGNIDYYQIDQIFLREVIYPLVVARSMIHDSFFPLSEFSWESEHQRRKFPSPFIDRHFVGEVFDQNDVRHPDHYKMIPDDTAFRTGVWKWSE